MGSIFHHCICSIMVIGRLLVVVLLLGKASSAALLETRTFHSEAESRGLSTIPPASPDCWLNAVKALDHLEFENSGVDASACAWMTPEHQKALALELARCHLKDLGRTLELVDDSKCSIDTYKENLSDCLKNLSDAGVTTYTHFFSYVNQLCTRLLQEILVGHYYETSVQLAHSSELAEGRLKDIVTQQEHLWNVWREREEQLTALQEQFSDQIQQQSITMTNQALQLQIELQSQQENWLNEQKDQVRQQSIAMTNQALQLQNELQSEQDNWLNEQSILHRDQANELERQQEELQRLSETVAKTHQSMKPWSHGLDSIMVHAITGYSLLKGLLFSFGSICVILFFTLPRRFHWMRRCLIGFLLIEGFLEVLIVVTNDGWLSSTEQTELFNILRGGLVHLEFITYLIGTSASMCCRRYKEPEDAPASTLRAPPQQLSESFLDRHDELLQRLESSEERWRSAVRQQQNQTVPPPTFWPTGNSPQGPGMRYPPPMMVSPDAQYQQQHAARPTRLEETNNPEASPNPVAAPFFPSHLPNWNVVHGPSWNSMGFQPWMSPPMPQTYPEPSVKETIDFPPTEEEGSEDGKEDHSSVDEDDSNPKKRPASVLDSDESVESEEPCAKRPK